jgi:CubicO group peptidase (beta-lactamase class C family)
VSRSTLLLAALAVLVAAALVTVLCFPGLFKSQEQSVDDLVRRAMKQWRIPGLALAVVHDDRIVCLKGYGVRAADESGAVTADTLFPLASCTKSFTTLAMGMLVDEGKMAWDDPVRSHLPDFHLSDPLADAGATLRDLVTHRTGVATHDLLWYYSPFDLRERVRRAGKLEQARPFRSGLQYQVVLFGAAGLAVGRASGGTWQDYVQQRILDPLEMASSRCTFPGEAPGRDLASPHRKEPAGQVAVVPRYPLEAPDPAGSLHSTARDLANYLRFQLGDGTWEGRRLISAEQLAATHTPQVVVPGAGYVARMNPETLFVHVGMGWVVQDYRGKLLVMHGGAIDGFRTHVTLVPEARLGIAVLSNLGGTLACLALSNELVDLLLGLPTRDWSTYYMELFRDGERQDEARARALRERRSPGAKPPRPLAAYEGVYRDSAYGDCRITAESGQLIWSWGQNHCRLEYLEDETFLATVGPLVDAPFVFTPGPGETSASFRAMNRVFERVKGE